MRTKVLLIIDIYYITFIVVATLLTLFYDNTNLTILNYMPILFLVHGNITDALLYLISFSDSIIAIIYFVWLYFYMLFNYLFNKNTIMVDIFESLMLINKFINHIFHPPKYFI